jgi:hypothetical protein
VTPIDSKWSIRISAVGQARQYTPESRYSWRTFFCVFTLFSPLVALLSLLTHTYTNVTRHMYNSLIRNLARCWPNLSEFRDRDFELFSLNFFGRDRFSRVACCWVTPDGIHRLHSGQQSIDVFPSVSPEIRVTRQSLDSVLFAIFSRSPFSSPSFSLDRISYTSFSSSNTHPPYTTTTL